MFHAARSVCCMAMIMLCACGPDTSGQSAQEAGLTRTVLTASDRWTITGLRSATTENLRAIALFIHGTPGSADAWVDTLSRAPKNILGIALDRPGFGNTKPNDAVVDLRSQADAVIAAAQSIRTDQGGATVPIFLIGHSYGGPVAVAAGLQRPDLFSGLILVAAALDPGMEKVHFMQRLATWQPFKTLIGHTLRTSNAELIALKDELMTLQSKLGDLAVPIYILHGTKDTLVPIDNVPFMTAHFPSKMVCETQVLEGQNHFLPWNETDRIWAQINAATGMSGKQC
ncbi:MAG: alpha/beta fold hydrolase [Pseudomonadota bacterium]